MVEKADIVISPEETLMKEVVPELNNDALPTDAAVIKQREIDRVLAFVVDCIRAGEDYRDKFKNTWDEIEKQVRQEEPEGWQYKEAWQSKVLVGLQAKTSETAFSNVDAMIFPNDLFFEVRGVEKRDRDEEEALSDLIKNILDQGGYFDEKDFMLEEAIDIGTSFMKLIARPDKSGVDFVWRSCYDCLVDPKGGHNWENHRFWIDRIENKDISDLIREASRPGGLYKPEEIQTMLNGMSSEGAGSSEDGLAVVRGIDGTTDVKIPKDYKTVTLYEFWGLVPMPWDGENLDKGYVLKPMVVTVVNKSWLLRKDPNAYGFIPVVPAKIKPRKYDFYGKGYLFNGRGTQELMNSMVNLGFDSQKMTSMDIAVVDANNIADQSSIKYKPMAVWLVKGPPDQAVSLRRQSGGVSAMNDLMTGVALLDQTHQDVTGVTRHAEGTSTIDGKKGGDNTLGEYQLKLQAVDRRFMSQAKRFEEEHIKRLLEAIYKIIKNPVLFTQEAADEILGMKEVPVPDPVTGNIGRVLEVPRLILKPIQEDDRMTHDFIASGVMQFSARKEVFEKLKMALEAALSNPLLSALSNVDLMWKKLFQVSDIPDWEDLIKDPEQIKKLVGLLQGMGGMPGQGAPVPGAPGPAVPAQPPLPGVPTGMRPPNG